MRFAGDNGIAVVSGRERPIERHVVLLGGLSRGAVQRVGRFVDGQLGDLLAQLDRGRDRKGGT
jgi:hypothetical protein